MMFNEEFDRSLSLILGNDIRNREKINNLIKSIPLELISKINKTLQDRANDSETIELEQSVKDESSESVFVVKITPKSLSICIFKWKLEPNTLKYDSIKNPEEYELILDRTSIDTIINAINPFYIGSYYYLDCDFISPSELVLYKGYINKKNKLVVQIDDTYEEYERETNIDILSMNSKNTGRSIGSNDYQEPEKHQLVKQLTPSKQNN